MPVLIVELKEEYKYKVYDVPEVSSNLSKEKIIDEFKKIADEKLLKHLRPVDYKIVDEIPLTIFKKVDYQKVDKMGV